MEIIETDYELEPMFNNLVKLMIPRIGDKPIELKKTSRKIYQLYYMEMVVN